MSKVPDKCPMCGEKTLWKKVDESNKGFSVGKAAVGAVLYVGNNTGKNLDGICWNCMRSEMKSHFKMETAKKRQPTEIIMTKVSSAEDEVIALEILKSVMENLTIRQQNIITLKLLGYSNTEICLMMEMSKSSYYRELENIRQTIVNGKF